MPVYVWARTAPAFFLSAAAASLLAGPAPAQRAGAMVRAARADLADAAAGRYAGAVSDARGPASGQIATVARVGPNQVRVTFENDRLPAFTAVLTRAMGTIRNMDGRETFILDLLERPHALTMIVAGESWSGTRE